MGAETTTSATPALGGTAIKPIGWDRSGLEQFKYFMYDPSTGAILSRTPLSWIKIISFYMIYYTVLAGFWIGCMLVFFKTLPDGQPKWLLSESLIGSNPGVGVRPPTSDLHIDSSMYQLGLEDTDMEPTNDKGEGEKNIDYAKRMELFMKAYENKTGLHECDGSANNGKCLFDVSAESLGDCAASPYGFMPENNSVNPCFFLKLNKIWNFVPVGIKAAEVDQPEYDDMTDDLKDIIRGEGDADQVYIDCKGRFPADQENIDIEFFPKNQAFPSYYFPFLGGNYQSPLVAIKVNTARSNGALMHLECRAWFQGVIHSGKEKAGLTQFEILIR
jgi:sodium/potassium-transporting ATPase subunit beta